MNSYEFAILIIATFPLLALALLFFRIAAFVQTHTGRVPFRDVLSPTEREQALEKITRDAYLIAENAAKQNRGNGVAVSPAWKLAEATRQARLILEKYPALQVDSRELALRLEAQVVAHDPKHKGKVVNVPSSVEVKK